MHFKSKLVAATSSILLLSLSILSINQYLKVRSSIDELVNSSVNEVSHQLAGNIARILEGKRMLGRYVMDLIEDDISNENIERVFTKNSVKSEFILAGVGFENDGRIVDNDPAWIPASDYDSRKRPWYIDAKRENAIIVTPPYPDSVTKEILVSVGVPMRNSGQFIGAMFLDVSLKGLGEILNRVKPLDAGFAFLVSDNNTLISHPDVELNGKPMSDYFGNKLNHGEKLQNITVNEQDLLVKFVKVPGVDWHLGVALDEATIGATADSLRTQSILYSIMAIILGMLAVLMLIRKLMAPLDKISHAMQDIASGEGDLTQRLSTNSDKEFARVALGFNGFTEKLQILIRDSKKLGEQISRGAEETSEGASQSVAAIEKQLAELGQLATAMTQMSSTSLEVAGYAQQAATSAEEADAAVTEGAGVVNMTCESILQLSGHIENAVDEVKQLENSTASIETILSVISGIAEQTNLLALNAAIEAARAGEQGRGFAVVADEVRNLAQRTQESTAEIKNMIEILQQSSMSVAKVMAKSQDEAADSVEKAQQANIALNNISDAINRITQMNMQIAAAAEEQSLVAEEVNRNTTNIKDLSQQVAESATITNNAMTEQKQIAQQQHDVLGRFVV